LHKKIYFATYFFVARYKHTYHFNVNKGINGNTSEIDIVPDEEIERILKDFASKRVIAASIIFDLFKKSGINLSSQTKLSPSWR
jgi:ribosomal protein S25